MPTRPALLSMPSPSLLPPRRRHAYLLRSLTSLVLLTVCLTFTLALAARPPTIPDTLVPPADWDLASYSGDLLKRGYVDLELRKEDEKDKDESTATSAPSKSSSTISGTPSVATATPTNTAVELPKPFDSNIGANFASEECAVFIASFLANPEFQACYAVSLLLESSQAFFQTLRSPFLTTAFLDHSCAAPASCAPYLSSLASSLNSTCRLDLSGSNPTATMALTGLLAYPSLRTATCLKSSTGSYCFADAITNSTSDEDAYVYYLGVGNQLPATTSMTCNQCLRDVVGVFGAAAANRTSPVARVYAEGARVVNGVCGKGWVNETVPMALTGAAASPRGFGGVVVAVMVGVMMVVM
ncbi:hypothetical protein VC83_08199 [Pseudogymnoascus destructans]|uniref:DUF7729 domain-containing protein n=2 Tax=Pseudogymnoascus destructans TaxID=655981 RepID=L8FY63_PSED2|nr:uncharacterized protein VC83_08199 [Pseudogymnoascus destructans]ELR05955.1 hypothetical protein GMDG_01917 [Pseudogymnoascus destructans 20631-21]OAF55211.1 hypothetical protein VC83_08199 [Pseudogymnoascus destructans]